MLQCTRATLEGEEMANFVLNGLKATSVTHLCHRRVLETLGRHCLSGGPWGWRERWWARGKTTASTDALPGYNGCQECVCMNLSRPDSR